MSTVRKRGDAWQAMVRIKKDGAIIFQDARTFRGAKAERLAQDWADKLEARIKRDGVPARKMATTTLGALLRRYAEERNTVSPLRRNMVHELEQLATEFDKVSLDDMRAQLFTEFARRRRADGAGPVTVMHNLATVRAALNAASPMFGLEVDGTQVAKAISALMLTGGVATSRNRDRRPTHEELERLTAEFHRVSAYPSTIIPMATIVALAVALPRRLGELTRMRWDDLKGNVITLHDTKNPRMPRKETVPVPPKAATIIAGLPVFDERILPYEPDSVSAAFERACARLRIDDLRFHDLRHEGITRLFEVEKLPLEQVAMISGHLSWTTLRRYTHLKPQTVLDNLNASFQEAQEAAAERQ